MLFKVCFANLKLEKKTIPSLKQLTSFKKSNKFWNKLEARPSNRFE